VEWEILFDLDFNQWFEALPLGLQDEIWACIELLRRFGPNLGRPRVDTVQSSSFSNMKELRIQYRGDPWRIFFAFDPHQNAIMLVGGNKRGKKEKRWYRDQIRIADERFRRYLHTLSEEE
jgi:hypothetical protein